MKTPEKGCHYCFGTGKFEKKGKKQPCPKCNGSAVVPVTEKDIASKRNNTPLVPGTAIPIYQLFLKMMKANCCNSRLDYVFIKDGDLWECRCKKVKVKRWQQMDIEIILGDYSIHEMK